MFEKAYGVVKERGKDQSPAEIRDKLIGTTLPTHLSNNCINRDLRRREHRILCNNRPDNFPGSGS